MFGNFYHLGWGYGFSWIFMLLFWGLIIWAIIMLAKNISNEECRKCICSKKDQTQKTPLDILKERYAKGEVSKEEFDKMKIDLQ